MSNRTDPAAARRRVLIVDDEPDSAATTALLLRRMGADVETAHDGEQAVDAAVRFEPQIVLLDIGLPRMNGYEAASRIRERLAGRPLKLVALTGWARDEDLRRAREAGFDHHLVKPVEPAVLGRLFAEFAATDAVDATDAGVTARGAPAAAEPPVRRGLVAEMSHDIRTPLNTLFSATHLLLESRLDPDQRSLVQTLRRTGESLRAIVDHLVDLESLETGTLVLDAVHFRPSALLAGCLVAAGPGAAERRVDLTCRVESSVPAELVGDAGRIRRIVLDLMDRALRTSAAERVSVTVAARPAGDGRFEIHVCARDAAAGVSSRADSVAARPQVDGTVAVAPDHDGPADVRLRVGQILCARMGGRMWFEGDAARGGSSHFTFLAAPAPAPSSALRDAPEASATPLRVLVADDDPVSRRHAIVLLADLGVTADTAASGREAVAAVSRTPYDAVIVDARMPGMDGVDAVREIRRIAPPPHGPCVIAMSASTARSDRRVLVAAGAEACLTKPLTADALRGALAVVRPPADGRTVVPSTLDAGVVEALRAKQTPGGPDVLDRLIGLFLDDTPIQMHRLREAAGRRDAGAVEQIAHRLRGSSGTIGATHLMTLAADVERRAQRGGVAAAAAEIEALEGVWLVTRTALERARRAPR